ncbi:MAG: DUF4760 domain-containing protein [Paracoccaceae bacterium]
MRLTWALAGLLAGAFLTLFVVDPIETKHISAFGVAFAIATFIWNAQRARAQQRKQHTITILFQTRLSPEFRENLAKRKRFFKEGEKVRYSTYLAYLTAQRDTEITDDEALRRRESAEAIRSLLNYYEFIALGVSRHDLDESMLKGSIRGIMCALVVDMADIILAEQRANSLAYNNLTRLFTRWRHAEPDPGFVVTPEGKFDDLRRRLAQWLMP